MPMNFDLLCRLCMTRGKPLLPLFDKHKTFPSKIKTFAPDLKMFVGDNLPTQICVLCAQKVDAFHDFKLQCERSDVTLRQYLKDQNSPAQPVKERNPNRKCISEIPVSSNEEDQGLLVEVQVEEHSLMTDSSDDDQR
ncbi:hypothetical protein L798_06207 [Zootermopsis nevadensis]|uniref:ZAD domain-containing protein n=3 Tax=Zootermopsis nevadensis TaxID=136037 RepID=A0A067R7G2_ZOONE|nr:hypothetical protein L798_06207 [Zootermopsis nevadensis]